MAQVSLVNDSQNNFLTADAYGSYERQEDHIYNVTDSYIGSDKKIERMEKILNLETMRIEEKEVTLPKGVENIFSEISSNAGDNVARSKRKGVNPGKIVISMTDEIVKVRNGGISIPIEMHKERNMWVPELIFGTLLSSVNYDKNVVRTECGRNGYGSKLTNIFSKEFTIIIADPRNGKLYHQVWNDNMNVKHDPTITDYPSDGESFVEIMYKLDFERFGYTCYPKEAYNIFARHAVDLSLTGRIPVIFNEHEFNIKSSREYAELYFGKDMAESSIVYYQWPKKTKTTTKNGVKYCEDTMIIPKIDICIVDTPDKAFCVAFSNGKWNTDGGVHVDAGYKAVSKGVLDTVNGKKQRKKIKLSTSDIKKHVTMFISCWVDNAEFSNQTKTKLTSPKIKITINDEVLTPIMKWDLVSRLHAELTAKHFKADSKTDGKKHRHISLNKLEDANKAGTYESHKCTLYVTEGASASSYAVKAIELDEKGRDYYGIYPMKGKPLNVMKALPEKIRANKEIQDLKEALGLKERVDYKIPENFKTLRYGQFMVLADADDDGKHILGLILNLFYCKFPSLLEIGYVKYLRTKILDVQKGNRKIKFYSKHEFDKWIKRIKNPDAWKVSYFKGLGTSEDHDIAEEFENPKIVKCVYDDGAPTSFNLAFHKDMANQRKKWIDTWVPNYKVEQMDIQPISQFINHEFIQFSIADNYRSIPKFIDGLKISQRKIIWGSMKKWKSKVGAHDAAQIKVDQLAAYVQGKTEYKHGGMSLEGAIKTMAQDFIGSNNMPYFCRHGQYGCVDPKTPILLWSGDTIKAEHVKIGDELIGDDGQKRTVSHVVSGIDDMYEISQTYGDSYIVNSIHILTLIVTLHKNLFWKDSTKTWVLQYYDRSSKKVVNKTIRTSELNTKDNNHYNKSKITKEEGYKLITKFRDTITDDNIVDIPLNEYLKLPQNQKDYLYGFKNYNIIQWSKQDIPIDPYIFGAWLGDGDHCGRGFTTIDTEIVKKYCSWADTIDAEIVHHTNTKAKTYHYGIRRRGSGYLPAIGDPNYSSNSCVGCNSSKNICSVCDWKNEKFKRVVSKINGSTKHQSKRSDFNPFTKILKTNNLYKNKHILDCYIKNDVPTRLGVLAGLIDTDGTIRKHSNDKGYHVEISQKDNIHGHILDSAKIIASSLGFKTRIYKDKKGMKILMIAGYNLHIIPTLLPHKKIPQNILSKNPNVSKITVKKVKRGKYCGWHIDGNERFLLGDYTVTHNTRNMLGKDASASRYIKTKPEWWWPFIYKKEDMNILEIIKDEGQEIEPKTLLPIIPMQLVNGALGIGTGHSTLIPSHNPLDICAWIQAKLTDKKLPPVFPWYRNFKGKISINVNKSKKSNTSSESTEELIKNTSSESTENSSSPKNISSESTEDNMLDVLGDSDEFLINKDTKYRMVTNGIFTVSEGRGKKVIITELPIGKATHKYTQWLNKMREQKIIKKFNSYSGSNKIHFEIYGMKNPSLRKLKLTSSFGLSNMVMLDSNNKPHKYNDTVDILETFYHIRLAYYEKRKTNILSELSITINKLNDKVRFIESVIKGNDILKIHPNITFEDANKENAILIMGQNKKNISSQLERLNFDISMMNVSLVQCTLEKIEDAKNKIQELVKERNIIEKTSTKQLWFNDIELFIKRYCKEYKCKYIPVKKIILNIKNA